MPTFKKPEHLCLQRDIDALFNEADASAASFPLRAVWRAVTYTNGPTAQVLVSVSKKKLRHAVDRNRAKRQMREAYRLNKHLLQTPEGRQLHIAFIWLATTPIKSEVVARKMVILLQQINKSLSKQETPAANEPTKAQ